jgi:hypothetical protein
LRSREDSFPELYKSIKNIFKNERDSSLTFSRKEIKFFFISFTHPKRLKSSGKWGKSSVLSKIGGSGVKIAFAQKQWNSTAEAVFLHCRSSGAPLLKAVEEKNEQKGENFPQCWCGSSTGA